MINRIRKFLFGSITKQLLWSIIFCLIVSYLFYSFIWSLGGATLFVKDLLYNSNEIFVELNAHLGNFNGGKAYVEKLAEFYNMSIAIIDSNGKTVLKDSSVVDDNIDMEYIRKILQGEYKRGEFYQVYDMDINQRDYKLVIWSRVNRSFIQQHNLVEEYFIFTIVLTIILFTVLLYLLIRKKIKYISYITSTITSISYGNLDKRIEIKGYDELTTLAGKINEMTSRLNNAIEQERAAESFNKSLITNVSHDLRTPLTSIIGYLELLKSKELADAKKEEYVKILNTRADRLKYLIDDLFEYTKVSSGGEQLNTSSIDVIELLEQCVGEHDSAAVQKGITFKKSFSEFELVITADAPKLARVFENIISNAVKYGENNSEIKINVTADENDIKISFKNISSIALDSNVKHIFDRFYRMDKSRNSDIEGSGLGLAIARSIIELHRGDIWANVLDNEFEIIIKIKRSIPLHKAN